MRLTDEQIRKIFLQELYSCNGNAIVDTVRKCLALAALPDAPSDYADVERRGFSVSQPGELPK